MKQKIIKMCKSLKFILFLSLLSLSIVAVSAQAAWNSTVSSAQLLTDNLWNDVVAKLVSLNSSVTNIQTSVVNMNTTVNDLTVGGYRLLATLGSGDEESRTTLYPNGNSAVYTNAPRIINVINSGWNAGLSIDEIVFVVSNGSDDYCVGGSGAIDLLWGANTMSSCSWCTYNGASRTCNAPAYNNDWIALSINGVRQTGCPQDHSGSGGALYGAWRIGMKCIYQVNKTVSSITVDQADWSGGDSAWNWSIYYR